MTSPETEPTFLVPWTDEDDRALEIYDNLLQKEQAAAIARPGDSPVSERFGNTFLMHAASVITESLSEPLVTDFSDLA